MELAYKYVAKNTNGKVIGGFVYGPNSGIGFSALKKRGMSPISLKLDFWASLSNIIQPNFDQRELARLYATLGRRLSAGKSIVEGLAAAVEYVKDQKLKQAVMAFQQSVLDGQNEHQAMTAGGFPSRDAMVVRSMASAGRTGEAFASLALEVGRAAKLKNSTASVLRTPLIMGVAMYIFLYCVLIFVAPKIIEFLAGTNIKLSLSAFNQAYFAFTKFFNANIIPSSIVYWLIPVGIFAMVKAKWLTPAINAIPLFKNLAIKSDMTMLWGSFGMLYEAAIPVKDACMLLASAASLETSRASFLKMAKLISSGLNEEQAVAKAEFPDFIVNGVKASSSGGNISDGIKDMVLNLEEDVTMLTGMLQEYMKIIAQFITGIGVGLIFFATYYPIATSVLSNM